MVLLNFQDENSMKKGKNILSETFSLGISTICAGNIGDIYLKDLNLACEGQCLTFFPCSAK